MNKTKATNATNPNVNEVDKNEIDATPTKRFFVSMLTRDIDLRDAILDLLDNCVDGIVRTIKTPEGETPYKGYWANIIAEPGRFEIIDNCGGIPEEVLRNSAFRQGRPEGIHTDDVHTVGMYGIGMKRAIYKLGRRAKMTTRNSQFAASVSITPEWLDSDTNWRLKLNNEDITILPQAGTKIEVEELYDNIAYHFSVRENDFLGERINH
jgi:hypothetical protein